MFEVGQKVVCIDDKFAPWVYDLYRALPVKDRVYTVRAVAMARSNPKFDLDEDANLKMSEADFDIMVLLDELHNPDDPHSSVKQELGFRAERFAEAEETHESIATHVGASSGVLVH